MPRAGDAYVDVHGDLSPLNRDLARGLNKGRLKRVGLAAGAAIAGGLLIETKRSLQAYNESFKVGRQTDAVLKSTGRQAQVTKTHIEALAGSISRKSGIDDEAIQTGQNLLLTFTKIRNETGRGNKIFDQATRVVTDMSVALGQDMKSSSIQVGKALNDPIKGVTALQRVGVSFTAQQKDQIASLVESGNRLKAQKLILRELRTEFGGSAAAAATPLDRLKVSLGNLEEKLGEALTPALQAAAGELDRFADDVNRLFERDDLTMDQKWDKLGDMVGDKIEAALPKIADAAADIAPKVAEAFVGGFLKSGAWGQLLLGGFLLKKLGGGKAAKSLGAKIAGGIAGGIGGSKGGAGGVVSRTLGGAAGGISGVRGPAAAGSIANPIVVVGADGVGGLPGKGKPRGGPISTTPKKGPRTSQTKIPDAVKAGGAGGAGGILSKVVKFGKYGGRIVGPIAMGVGIVEAAFLLESSPHSDQTDKPTASERNDANLARKNPHARFTAPVVPPFLQQPFLAPGAVQKGATDQGKRLGAAQAKGIADGLKGGVGNLGRVTADVRKGIFSGLSKMAPETRKLGAAAAIAMASELQSKGKLSKDAARRLRSQIIHEFAEMSGISVKEARKILRGLRDVDSGSRRTGNAVATMAAQVITATARLSTGRQRIKALGDAFSGLNAVNINGFLGSLSTLGDALGATGSLLQAATKPPKKRATGGRVNEAMTLVGERGPELVSLPVGSYVHTNTDSKAIAARYGIPGFAGGGSVRASGYGRTNKGRGMSYVPGDPAGPYDDAVANSILSAVTQWRQLYKLNITAAYNPDGGHSSPGHNYTGRSTDVAPGPGGSWDTVEAALKAVLARGYTVGYGSNGIGQAWRNHGRGNHGHVDWPSNPKPFTGSSTRGRSGASRAQPWAGKYESTAYGPPWNAMEGTGITKTGIKLGPNIHKYIVAVDPDVIPLHSKLKANPNPFGDKNIVFAAEDIGGAIQGNKIDFYDWRGRASQNKWGRRMVTVHSAGFGSGGTGGKKPEFDENRSELARLEYQLSRAKKKPAKLRAIGKLIRYWQRRHKAAVKNTNWAAAKSALEAVRDYQQQRREITQTDEENLYKLGGLSTIGKGGKVFNIGGLQRTLDVLDLQAAKAALTEPADDSQAALKAALQDDIDAATRTRDLWDFIYKLTESRPGTPAQQLEAATNLKNARDNLKGFTDQVNQAPATATDSGVADLLRGQLDESNRYNAILAAQMPAYKRFAHAPFAGVFHDGGVVPGPIGADRAILAQGGETITPAGEAGPAGADGSNITLVFHEGAIKGGEVDPEKIELVVDDKLAKVVRQSQSGPMVGRKYVFPR